MGVAVGPETWDCFCGSITEIPRLAGSGYDSDSKDYEVAGWTLRS